MEAIDFLRSFFGIFAFKISEKPLPFKEEWSDEVKKDQKPKVAQKSIKSINRKIMKK